MVEQLKDKKITIRDLEKIPAKLPALTKEEIQVIRHDSNLSQAAFATFLNVSDSTVKKWEQGDKSPSGSSLKLLYLIKDKGIEVLI